ncbi:PREDICTED: uncharacterized protein LOC106323584 [Brassica oleracea var. oleracea]|uniref:uncharacterized protein LOC106323584 n=1 Tax=Brassica oleracea var. oleracea TaxID=109376 RepID=UPI0006A73592|nr:PREDICTED: uncharacterized protein LOC106323584 [Brassica oleracea var. oleracea]
MVVELMIDPEQYEHWKVKMKASFQSIDLDVWASVEDGYEVPKIIDKDGVVVNKPLAKWTKCEKEMSKYNAKALCGTEKVKSSRMDFFKSKFENLKMEEHESVSDFSSQLSALAQEARVLGMEYKDKKLVKKFIRQQYSESEERKYDEGQDDDLKECYKQVCGTLLKLGKENMVLVKEQRRLEALIEVLQKDLQKGKTKSVSMSAMKPIVRMYARTTSYGKTAVKTATATRTASSSATRKIPEFKDIFDVIVSSWLIKEAHQKVEPKKLVRKYVGTCDKECGIKLYSM